MSQRITQPVILGENEENEQKLARLSGRMSRESGVPTAAGGQLQRWVLIISTASTRTRIGSERKTKSKRSPNLRSDLRELNVTFNLTNEQPLQKPRISVSNCFHQNYPRKKKTQNVCLLENADWWNILAASMKEQPHKEKQLAEFIRLT